MNQTQYLPTISFRFKEKVTSQSVDGREYESLIISPQVEAVTGGPADRERHLRHSGRFPFQVLGPLYSASECSTAKDATPPPVLP